MAAGAVSLRKSHDIVILSFCNIVKGQAKYLLILLSSLSLYLICISALLHVKLLCILVAAPISIESELKNFILVSILDIQDS